MRYPYRQDSPLRDQSPRRSSSVVSAIRSQAQSIIHCQIGHDSHDHDDYSKSFGVPKSNQLCARTSLQVFDVRNIPHYQVCLWIGAIFRRFLDASSNPRFKSFKICDTDPEVELQALAAIFHQYPTSCLSFLLNTT